MTDRNKETACPICPLKEVWKQLQPGIVAVHDQLSMPIPELLRLDLGEPGVLCCECRSRVGLGKVQDNVQKGGDGAGGDRFDAGHGDGGRGSVSREGEGSAVSNQTG